MNLSALASPQSQATPIEPTPMQLRGAGPSSDLTPMQLRGKSFASLHGPLFWTVRNPARSMVGVTQGCQAVVHCRAVGQL
jgi:hypothetical protein